MKTALLLSFLLVTTMVRAQETAYKEYYKEKPTYKRLLDYACSANTYISKSQSDLIPAGKMELSDSKVHLKSYSKRHLSIGVDGKTNWDMARLGDSDLIKILPDKDSTLIISAVDGKDTEYLKNLPELNAAKVSTRETSDGQIDLYEISLKANVPFKIKVLNFANLGFEIPEEKTIVTCSNFVDALLKSALVPDPTAYGESMTEYRTDSELKDLIKKYKWIEEMRSVSDNEHRLELVNAVLEDTGNPPLTPERKANLLRIQKRLQLAVAAEENLHKRLNRPRAAR